MSKSMTKAKPKTKTNPINFKAVCLANVRTKWGLKNIDDAITKELWSTATWTPAWYRALNDLCTEEEDYDEAVKLMWAPAKKQKNSNKRKLYLIGLKKAAREARDARLASDQTTESGTPEQGPRANDDETPDGDEGENHEDQPADADADRESSSPSRKKVKMAQGRPSTADRKTKAKDAREADDEETSGRDGEQRNDKVSRPGGKADLAEKEQKTPEPMYCIGPCNDQNFQGRIIAKDITQANFGSLEKSLRENKFFCVPVNDTRHVYRMIAAKVDLDDWYNTDRGTQTPCNFDTKDRDCSSLLAEVNELMWARWFMKSITLDDMKRVDTSERTFIAAIARAKKAYAEDLKRFDFLPLRRKTHLSTDKSRHYEEMELA